MTGEGDAFEAASEGDGGVFVWLTEGVFAQPSVAVGFVENRDLHHGLSSSIARKRGRIF